MLSVNKLFNRFLNRFATNYEKFSNDTNVTGFKEMHQAKSKLFKIVWLVLILFGIAFTSYQCWFIINEYMKSPTNTVIQQLRGVPKYPPLHICYVHWIMWVDWDKVDSLDLNLDRESFLYAMSLSKTVFVENPMENFTRAKENFEKMMVSKNYSDLTSFYLSIARDSPLGVTLTNKKSKTNFVKNFHDYWGSELCYILDISLDEFDDYEVINCNCLAVQLGVSFDYNIRPKYVSELEKNYYLYAAFASQSKTKSKLRLNGNESAIFISPMIYADGTIDMVLADPNYFQYILKLKGTVYKWISSADEPCASDRGVDVGGRIMRNCERKCELKLKWNSTRCAIFEDMSTSKYKVEICRRDIVLANIKMTETETLDKYKPVSMVNVLSMINEDKFDVSRCYSDCAPRCEQWLYETSTVTNLRPYQFRNHFSASTEVQIQYPYSETIVVVTETPSTTWQKMLSDIGGLLGLWLGANLLSLVQMVYLCCCRDVDEFISRRGDRTRMDTSFLRPKRKEVHNANKVHTISMA